ncbi:hypothetical protein DMP15_18550 [Pseudonocardia sp. UM4_GMWB1]|uniref:hypothetical protein n=1 Tax=Pseudonocardia sp. UM4_GMWB1 TaxID=2212989 RepID=UPI00307DA9EC
MSPPTLDQLVPGGPAVGPLRRHALAAIAAETATVMTMAESLAARALPQLADVQIDTDGVLRARHRQDPPDRPRFVVDADRLRSLIAPREVEAVSDTDWRGAVDTLAAQHPPAPIADAATPTVPVPDRAVPRPGSWLRGRR